MEDEPPKREPMKEWWINPANRWAGSWLTYCIEWIAWKIRKAKKP